LLHFRVRLACVRHAASVDSEPGSNSHVKFVVLRRHSPLARLAAPEEQLFNARPMFFGSALFNPLFDHGSPPASVVRTDNSGRPIPRRHALILIVRRHSPACAVELRRDGSCVCLHALSSFQRTDNSKRPGRSAHDSRLLRLFRAAASACRPRSGELTEITIAAFACQALFPLFFRGSCSIVRGSQGRLGRSAAIVRASGNAVDLPGSISGDNQSSLFGLQQTLRCPAAGVSRRMF
jgi:hypothetical protein